MRRAVLAALFGITISTPATAYDSRCRIDNGEECEPGPFTAQHRWNAVDSEHMHLWDKTVSGMGFPDTSWA